MFKPRFPDEVNEVAARIVAAGVVAMAASYIVMPSTAVPAVVAYGFWARVLYGPRFSPLARIAVAASARFAPRPVPGTPKRFAQGIGSAVSSVALVLHLLGETTTARGVMVVLVAAAGAEAVAGYCLGCRIFAVGVRRNWWAPTVCQRCSDWARS
jgi:hypothetical protein